MTQAEIDALLTAAKDEKYREFHSKIINTNLTMWGVRIPYIHKLAKQIARTEPKFFKTYKPENYERIIRRLKAAIREAAMCEEDARERTPMPNKRANHVLPRLSRSAGK